MTKIKISALPQAAILESSNYIPILQDGANKKTTYSQILNLLYPVGTVFLDSTGVDPATYLGFGTWIRIELEENRMYFTDNVSGSINTFGSLTTESQSTDYTGNHTLTTAELPVHGHGMSAGELHCSWVSNGYGSLGCIPSMRGQYGGSYGGWRTAWGTGMGGQAHNHPMIHTHDYLPPLTATYGWYRSE